MQQPKHASKCNQAFGTWAPGACTACGARGAAGRARVRVQQAGAQRHPNGVTRVLHTCHAKWRESGVNVPLSTARKRHEHAARARQGVRHKRSLCTLQKLGLDRPVLAAPQLEPWRSSLQSAEIARRSFAPRRSQAAEAGLGSLAGRASFSAMDCGTALSSGYVTDRVLFYNFQILFKQTSIIAPDIYKHVSVLFPQKRYQWDPTDSSITGYESRAWQTHH